ncbi:MAG: hypothetical protein RMN52_02355 [Anaerolineae bacterium]|nr:hypothetical protein [Candidatus Roseilinea sp.]MDW8448823.1 hypothetical protein [Anaerolineae bacterium]
MASVTLRCSLPLAVCVLIPSKTEMSEMPDASSRRISAASSTFRDKRQV